MTKVTIDLITETKDSTAIKLYVAAREYRTIDLDWLVAKVDGYLDAIEFGVLDEKYPETANKRIIIQIDVIGDPPDNVVNFILNNHKQIVRDKPVSILLHKVRG